MLACAVGQTMEKSPIMLKLDVVIVFDKLVILSVGLITLGKLAFFYNLFHNSTLENSRPFYHLAGVKQIVKIIVHNTHIFRTVYIDFFVRGF